MKRFFVGPSGSDSSQGGRPAHRRLPLGIWFPVILIAAGWGLFQGAAAEPLLGISEIVDPNAVEAYASWDDKAGGDAERVSRRPETDRSQRRHRSRSDRSAIPRDAGQRGLRDAEGGANSKRMSRQFADEVFQRSGGAERCVPMTMAGSEVVQCFQGSKRRLRSVEVSNRDGDGRRSGSRRRSQASNRERACGMTAINVNDPDKRGRDVTLPTSECQ